jgi:protein-S-isoprenylcysteine O-methyltransferase Ste14
MDLEVQAGAGRVAEGQTAAPSVPDFSPAPASASEPRLPKLIRAAQVVDSNARSDNADPDLVKAVIRTIITCGVVLGLLFATAGTLQWWNGWLFVLGYSALVASLTGFFSKSPDLVEERMTAGKKAKTWDRWLFALIAAVLPLLATVLAGLDRRFGWTDVLPVPVVMSAFAVMVASNVLTFWAMRVNAFFSSHVRIQDDRGHTVVSAGPYRFVRHPGYLGAIIYNLAAPIVLCSLPAFCVGIAMLLLFVARTVLEDRALQEGLTGYREYAIKVRFRLVPFVW